ncbi:hypothetical protein MPTK1_1g01590 [Marchantia polymorpha subsp. ruderalis]|uniref:Uncharacterized protein n=2 Tax=Marchantia polymorpha TaxID=3197 RepID=A0A176W8L0_MARPO|nr:hypothetical protein AXG93_2960s1300 [Marchantia polymorpha subsp. ruderalis]PTQ42558.1 hypothetical protein MARPO_0029s0088 [Marchantia polymorpha]BBM96924.1 hypothetical protein Mp_1g01590 [Marchantia polymorpha subsp. ruderalis]|eukprot:PTQ42558.1 hypothetical protein MARPO_0029s0088 [Marchantia polymorpha]
MGELIKLTLPGGQDYAVQRSTEFDSRKQATRGDLWSVQVTAVIASESVQVTGVYVDDVEKSAGPQRVSFLRRAEMQPVLTGKRRIEGSSVAPDEPQVRSRPARRDCVGAREDAVERQRVRLAPHLAPGEHEHDAGVASTTRPRSRASGEQSRAEE